MSEAQKSIEEKNNYIYREKLLMATGEMLGVTSSFEGHS